MSESVTILTSKRIVPFFKRYSIWISAAVVLILLPVFFNSNFTLSLLNQTGIAIILALSYNMLFGHTGLLSFGHAVYFGLGGFSTIHALRAFGESEIFFPVSLLPLVGGAGGLFFALIFGFVSTRRPGVPFALITLGIGELVTALSLIFNSFFGGEEGIAADRVIGAEPFGISLGPLIEVYYLIAVWVYVCVFLIYMFSRTPIGRICNAVRDNPERSQFIGYNPQRVRWIVFSVSGFFAGIAGGLFAINYEIVTYETVTIIQNSGIIMMTYIGGVRLFWGPILGAIVYTFLWATLSDYTEAWLLYIGFFFVLFVMYAPGGLAGLLSMHEPFRKGRLIHKLIPTYIRALVPGAVFAIAVIAFIEISYTLSFSVGGETDVSLFGIRFDAGTPWPWIVLIPMTGIGLYFLRRSFPVIRSRW
ncbi:MAG: branched-chain amino acid ABC transporter permease, partial [Deltaproteobacteria bacterium]|nr:branched-chain amino acid ABC transporter permease [Deltaproteobacteria bacterium]